MQKRIPSGGALLVLGVMAVPAGAVKVHALSPKLAQVIKHRSKSSHRLSAAQLRRDKAGAARLLKSLETKKAHSAQVLYNGSSWSDPMDPEELTDDYGPADCDDLAPAGPSDYDGAVDCYTNYYNDACYEITSLTFTYDVYSCIYVRQDFYEDVQNGVYYGIQLLCGTYYPGQESDIDDYGNTVSEGCQYADTYSIISAYNGNDYGLFTYES
jgi:hypothetical protein